MSDASSPMPQSSEIVTKVPESDDALGNTRQRTLEIAVIPFSC
jgi:hypothetical protein